MVRSEGEVTGLYVGVRFYTSTNKTLHWLTTECKVPNSVRPDRFHTTVMYSHVTNSAYTPAGILFPSIRGVATKVDLWKDQTGKTCAVLLYECDELYIRHETLKQRFSLTHPYNYIPHITLSYDVPEDFDVTHISGLARYMQPLIIIEEYSEPLSDVVADINKTKGN